MNLCTDCKYYDENSGAYGWNCARSTTIEPVEGRAVGFRRNDAERGWLAGLFGGCGPRAKHFQERTVS